MDAFPHHKYWCDAVIHGKVVEGLWSFKSSPKTSLRRPKLAVYDWENGYARRCLYAEG